MNSFTFPYKKFFSVLTLSILFACGNNATTTPEQQTTLKTEKFAVVATSEPSWTGSGAHSVVSLEKPRTAINDILATNTTDIGVSCNGNSFYRIERRSGNGSIVKFDINKPKQWIYQYSTDDPAGLPSNPIAIIFVNEHKAYVLRNMTSEIWVIDPSATTEATFKTKTIDLSHYTPAGASTPNMSNGVIVGDKLFVLLQRLDSSYDPSFPSYIAVFDTNTDEEIETNQGSGGLKGIELDVRNPYGKLVYNNGTFYLAGSIFPIISWTSGIDIWATFNNYSGIQKINATTYEVDHNIIHHAVNTITYLDIASPTKGYFVEYLSSGNTVLRSFNPTTGTVSSGNIVGIGNSGDRDIADIALDSEGKLWVADNSLTNPGLYIINTDDDTLDEGPISTGLNPKAITFCEK